MQHCCCQSYVINNQESGTPKGTVTEFSDNERIFFAEYAWSVYKLIKSYVNYIIDIVRIILPSLCFVFLVCKFVVYYFCFLLINFVQIK